MRRSSLTTHDFVGYCIYHNSHCEIPDQAGAQALAMSAALLTSSAYLVGLVSTCPSQGPHKIYTTRNLNFLHLGEHFAFSKLDFSIYSTRQHKLTASSQPWQQPCCQSTMLASSVPGEPSSTGREISPISQSDRLFSARSKERDRIATHV